MRYVYLLVVLLLSAANAGASILEVSSFDRAGKTIEVDARGASMHAFIRVIEMRTGIPILPQFADFRFDAELRGIPAVEALFRVTGEAGLGIEQEGAWLIVRDPGEHGVTLDVSNVQAEQIVEKVARECGYRNVWIPNELGRRGTFRFENVPCSIAMRIIFDSLGLEGVGEANGVLLVGTRK